MRSSSGRRLVSFVTAALAAVVALVSVEAGTARLTRGQADVTSTISLGGDAVTVSLGSGDNARIEFSASAGQRVFVRFTSVTVGTSSCCSMLVSLLRPDGSTLSGPTYVGTSGGHIDTTALPASGTYTIFVDPQGTSAGSATVRAYDVPADPSPSLVASPAGDAAAVTTTVPGTNVTPTFAGTAGQRVFVKFAPVAVGTSSCCSLTVSIRKPDGTTLSGTPKLVGNSGGYIDTAVLPTTGTYTIVADIDGAATGSLTVTLYDIPADPSPTLTPSAAGDTAALTIAVPGQNLLPNFAGSAGQRIFVDFSPVAVGTSTCCSLRVSIRKPDGSTLGATKFVGTSGGYIDTATLPSAGTYTIVADGEGSATGAVTIRAYDVPPDPAAELDLTEDPAWFSPEAAVPGQNLLSTFAGAAGQKVFVNFPDQQIGASSCCGAVVSVRKPDGSTLNGTAHYVGTEGGFIDTVTLPVSGTYSVVVDPEGTATGGTSVGLNEVPPDVTGTLTVGGDPNTLAVAIPGTNLAPTFSGVAGQVVRVHLTNVAIGSSSCCSLQASIRKPDGTNLVSPQYVGTSGGTIDATLPVSGTYTVFTSPEGAGTGSVTYAVTASGTPTANTNPTVTGTPANGTTLTASTGSWTGSPSSFAYQWQRCDAICADIANAQASSYTLTDDDVPDRLRVVVRATNASGAASAASPQTAAATGARTAPKWSRSYYVSTTNPATWYDLGCDLGENVTSGTRPGQAVVFLHFGAPTYIAASKRYGSVIFPSGTRSTSTLRIDAVQQYAQGYWACSPVNTRLVIVATTSNFGSGVTRAHGVAWGNMVDAANAYLRNSSSAGEQVLVYGGTDIELPWSTPAVARRWVDGYASATARFLYVDGEASGCPPAGGTCNNTWSNADVRYVNWGVKPAYPVPQIYREDGIQAEQWQRLSLFSADTFGSPMTFRGAMTQQSACFDTGQACGHDTSGVGDDTRNAPAQGWLQLYDEINADPDTKGNVRYSTDVRWDQAEN